MKVKVSVCYVNLHETNYTLEALQPKNLENEHLKQGTNVPLG